MLDISSTRSLAKADDSNCMSSPRSTLDAATTTGRFGTGGMSCNAKSSSRLLSGLLSAVISDNLALNVELPDGFSVISLVSKIVE